VRLDDIGAGRFDKRVQAGARSGASDGLTEQSIAPSNYKWPNRVLDPVGIERDVRMLEEWQKRVPLTQLIEHRFAQRTLRQNSVGHIVV
jgi:hypothetical protein